MRKAEDCASCWQMDCDCDCATCTKARTRRLMELRELYSRCQSPPDETQVNDALARIWESQQ